MPADTRRAFASDNWAGVHPEVLDAIGAANAGHVPAYGYDLHTAEAVDVFRRHFGEQAEVFPVFNGTGANVTALQTLVRSFGAVVCPDTAHVNTDECGGPERFTGAKLLGVATTDGKLTPELARPRLAGFGNEHHNQPRAISVTNATELGTVHTRAELRALADLAHEHGMRLHVDGSRLCNAAAHLGCGLRDITTDAGVDVLSFGGTKNGCLLAEAVVVLDPALAAEFLWIRKQSGQLASKMRYVSAQFTALLGGDLWLRNAAHANAMALRLAEGASAVAGVTLTQKVEANEVFATLPREHVDALIAEVPFYVWDESRIEVRWVCSWDTTEQDVDDFVELLRRTLV